MNNVMLVGRLAQDPEVRYTKNGKAVVTFTLAINRSFGQKEMTDFIPVVAWERLAETCGNNLTKGTMVFVQGRIQNRSYETADGQKRRVTEIIAEMVCKNLDEGGQRPASPVNPSSRTNSGASEFGQDVFPPSDEEIPF